MVWHAHQTVRDQEGEHLMQVYRCERCGQLQAVATDDKAA